MRVFKSDFPDIEEYAEIEKNLMLAPVEVGQVVRLNNIFFETAKAILKPESYPELDRIVDFLKENPEIEIEIARHTDNVGKADYNLKLSKDRAQAVADYLVQNGTQSSRLIVKGYGLTRPIAFNNDEECKARNRRVEFQILKK
jgi:outer membrane protein OmpA-like peptidoglycan-associated protein